MNTDELAGVIARMEEQNKLIDDLECFITQESRVMLEAAKNWLLVLKMPTLAKRVQLRYFADPDGRGLPTEWDITGDHGFVSWKSFSFTGPTPEAALKGALEKGIGK